MLAVQVQVQVQAKLQVCWPSRWLETPGPAVCSGGGRGTAPPGTNEYEWKYVVVAVRLPSAFLISYDEFVAADATDDFISFAYTALLSW